MKYAVAILSLAVAVSASGQAACDQYYSSIPSCALPCLQSAAAGAGCASGDYNCQCQPASDTKVQSAGQACVLKACGQSALNVVSPLNSLCACAETAASGGDSGSTPTSAAASTTAASSAAAAATPKTNDLVSSSSSGSDYGLSSPSITSSSTPSAPYPTDTGSSSVASTGGVNGTGTGVYPPIETGGAAKVVVSVAGGLAMVLGVVLVL